jgi:hypothetical protein
VTSPAFEAFLARIYVDRRARELFLQDPHAAALAAGLTAEEAAALERIDRRGLELTAHSLEAKQRRRSEGSPET